MILCAYAWQSNLLDGYLVFGLALTVYILTGGHYTLYLVWHSAARDMRLGKLHMYYLDKKKFEIFFEIFFL